MNNENFIKPIQKKSSSQLPVVTSPQPPATPEYDPIKRLTDELSRINDNYRQVVVELAALKQRQDRADQKPQPATYEQIDELASKRPVFNINAEKFAKQVQPALVASLPSAEQLQAAAHAGASEITASGTATAEQIRQAGAAAASRIEQATKVNQDAVLGLLSFRSWKQAIWLCFVPLLVGGASLVGYSLEYQKRVKTEEELTRYKIFATWINENYPAVWKKYNK